MGSTCVLDEVSDMDDGLSVLFHRYVRFFMGVPVFNVVLALPAGFFLGGWLVHGGAESTRMRTVARQAATFTTSVLTLLCFASATIALVNPSTGSDLEGMFSLSFQITPVMIICIILGGGISLLCLQWWLTLKSVERAYRYCEVHAHPTVSI